MPLIAAATVTATLITVAWTLPTNLAVAAEMNMRVFQLNDHLLCFYDGRPPPVERTPNAHNWADYGALDVGVATYVIHSGNQALVYDTFPTATEAQWARDYLREWGPPAIEPLSIPNTGIAHDTDY